MVLKDIYYGNYANDKFMSLIKAKKGEQMVPFKIREMIKFMSKIHRICEKVKISRSWALHIG